MRRRFDPAPAAVIVLLDISPLLGPNIGRYGRDRGATASAQVDPAVKICECRVPEVI